MPAIYRYECAKTGRAKCQTKHEDGEAHIEKGELRLGSLVTIKEHTTWKWKHWGCVTPAQIANILDQIGGLDGLDVDKDLDILDGYDELPAEAQEKIKYALVNGHVHNDDWNGDPELNVPGAKGLHKRTPKKKAKKDKNDEGSEDQEASPVPKAKKGKSKKQVEEDGDDEPVKKKASNKKRKAEAVEDEEVEEKPKPKRNSKKAKAAVKTEDDAGDLLVEEPKKAVKGRVKKEQTDAPAADAQLDGTGDAGAEKKPQKGQGRGTKKVEEEPGTKTTAKHAKSRANKVKQETADGAEDDEERAEADNVSKPTKSRRAKKVKDEPVADTGADEDSAEEAPATKPTRGRAKPKTKSK